METPEDVKQGLVYESLSRTNKQIRTQRGNAIAEDLEMIFKRAVEDQEMAIKRLEREQENAFDFSPDNAQSLVMSTKVDSTQIKDNDLRLGLEIRNSKIKLEIAKERYNTLFGPVYKLGE